MLTEIILEISLTLDTSANGKAVKHRSDGLLGQKCSIVSRSFLCSFKTRKMRCTCNQIPSSMRRKGRVSGHRASKDIIFRLFAGVIELMPKCPMAAPMHPFQEKVTLTLAPFYRGVSLAYFGPSCRAHRRRYPRAFPSLNISIIPRLK